ncbi:CHAT domain-containing protein [Lactarius psammicola]|nr:CHAT domain-containing protein [Lactarius psammicola]
MRMNLLSNERLVKTRNLEWLYWASNWSQAIERFCQFIPLLCAAYYSTTMYGPAVPKKFDVPGPTVSKGPPIQRGPEFIGVAASYSQDLMKPSGSPAACKPVCAISATKPRYTCRSLCQGGEGGGNRGSLRLDGTFPHVLHTDVVPRRTEGRCEVEAIKEGRSPESAQKHWSTENDVREGELLFTTNTLDDLDALIPLFTEVLLLPLDPGVLHFSQITKLFYKLACSLAFRFELSRSSEDLEYAIKYYRHLLSLPPKAIVEVNPLEVLDNLTRLLAYRVQLTTEVQPDHADEMVGMLQKLAILDPSSEHVGSIAKSMGTILLARLSQFGPAEECERALELLTDVEKVCQPERFPDFYVFLGTALAIRFQQTSLYDHCSQAITRFNKSLTLLPSEHPLYPLALMVMATVLHHRFTHDKQLRSLEESITYTRAALSSCPPGHLLRPRCLALLSGSLRWRYAFFGEAEFLREADSCVHDALSQGQCLPEPLRAAVENAVDESNAFIGGFQKNDSLEGLMEEIELQRKRLAKIPSGHPDQLDVLRSLALACGGKFHRTQELADLEDEINHHTMALAASPPDHYVRRLSLFSLGQAFQKRFLFDDQPRSLEESIKCCRDALALCPRGQMSRFEPLHTLALSLSLRALSFSSPSPLHQTMDFDESMALFQSALDEAHAYPFARYNIAGQWARCARAVQHPCTTFAYQTAMSLMQSSLALGPTLPLQHRLLKGRWGELAAVPLDFASYYIETGVLKRAVESLEQGRSLLWSEMRGLRTSMDRLRLSDGDGAVLAERFVAINGELESIATSSEAPEDSERPRDDEHHIPDAFGCMMDKVHELERKRAEIADQIRALPGFEDFLRAVPFDALQTAAACGPIVIINHSRFRCDIIIVLHDSSPVHIPMVEDSYSRTIKLKELLLSTRAKHALESSQYQRALRSVLEELYELVGRPVIEKLHELEIPEQSRVWWCPTSVLCSLPLHAAGPIESEGRGKRYFSDVYVSSYTPTLSALIESRKGITHTSDSPSLLIVAQPDTSLPGVWGEIEAVQKLAQSATTLLGPRATQKSVTKQLAHHRMVHFACHGTLEPERPFDTAFRLSRGDRGDSEERLSLLDICATPAEWTDAYTPDEALHLTAAMQYCGFRSAVGTLWAMADTDGRDLAEQFYKRVFAEEAQGVPLGERSARALRDAVRKLRKKKGVSLERWRWPLAKMRGMVRLHHCRGIALAIAWHSSVLNRTGRGNIEKGLVRNLGSSYEDNVTEIGNSRLNSTFLLEVKYPELALGHTTNFTTTQWTQSPIARTAESMSSPTSYPSFRTSSQSPTSSIPIATSSTSGPTFPSSHTPMASHIQLALSSASSPPTAIRYLRGYIAMLSVDKGYPSALVRHSISVMQASGAQEIALETEFDNAPALALYTSLGFVPEKRLHRFYLNGKDAFRLVLPLAPAEDPAPAARRTSSAPLRPLLPPRHSASSLLPPADADAHAAIEDDDDDDDESSSEDDYAEDTAKLVRLRRRVAALRGCRMITVWPADDDDDRVSGR